MRTILIVEDDLMFSKVLTVWLSRKDFNVISAVSVDEAKKQVLENTLDLILSDLKLADQNGIDLLKWLNDENLTIPVIMMTGFGGVESAVQAIKLGAKDYVEKPFNQEIFFDKIQEALKDESSISESHISPSVVNLPISSEATEFEIGNKTFIEGESAASRQLYEYINLVAPTNMSVLILGSSGTGKEHIARLIHEKSNRAHNPFVAIDCGAIPRDIAASELFGHVKGAFTGALTDKKGCFEVANGGTIFLDEIGNLSYEIQVQLLRALQERIIKPVGNSDKEISIDIRIIAATNEQLDTAIEEKKFREDLYHRVSEFSLNVPDLKDRGGDILQFAQFFLRQSTEELNKSVRGFSLQVEEAFLSYSWPGNLREMKNVIKSATLLCQTDSITKDVLPEKIFQSYEKKSTSFQLKNESNERILIEEALKQTGNNKSKAAALLGIDRKTLYNKLKLYDIK
ncbi:MAG: sigma-54-dependent transcriptional regulator [Bacteroidales bacterium]